MKKINQIINKGCLEGHSGSGKTSLATLLHTQGQIHRVGEFFHFLESGDIVPGIDLQDDQGLNTARQTLFTLLKRRSSVINSYSGSLPLLYERSPFTFLYTEAVRVHLGFYGNIKSLAGELLELLQSDQEPDYYIFLKLNHKLALSRLTQSRQDTDTNFFYQANTLEAMRKLLDFFEQEYVPSHQKYVFANENRETSVEEVKCAVQQFYLERIQQKNPIRKLCLDIQDGLDLTALL